MTGSDAIGAFAVDADFDQRIACSLAMRSAVDGWVEKSFEKTPPPPNGITINMWAVAGLASSGMRLDQVSSFCSAEINPYGVPVYCAAEASAEYSRVREIASWI